jgi:hypothetical protein
MALAVLTSLPTSTLTIGSAMAKSMTTVATSSRRSMMIVANVAVALRPSVRARRYGRRISPMRAGSRNVAVKPMTVVRNAVRKRAWPIGRRSACHRQARTT